MTVRELGIAASALPLAAAVACASAGTVPAGSASVATSPSRVDTFVVAMGALGGRERVIRVYLPPGYDAGTRRYPVLYLQDAQNLFRPGMYGDWQVDETLDRMVESGRSAGMIVVGIDNGPRRWNEYGPWMNRRMFDWVDSTWSRAVEGGEGDAYLDFLTAQLKPEIDGRYRTLADREHTAIGGSSMGGLISLWAGLTRPRVFSKVMAMSTAVWFAEDGGPFLSANRLLGWMRMHPLPRDVRFYLDVGTEERSRGTDPSMSDSSGRPVSYPRAYVQGSRAAADALKAGGVPAGNVRYVEDAGAVHNEAAWARRFDGAVTWLFR